MKDNLSPMLLRILHDTAVELSSGETSKHSVKRIKQMQKDAPPVFSFKDAICNGPGLIAEIKEKSPSQGAMRWRNVREAAYAYKQTNFVRAISVLTNKTHFGSGMTMSRMQKVKEQTGKPVLRKDFITDERQVHLARAYGADAILLMANILDADELKRLSDVAFELGMQVLFETHKASEVDELPSTAEVIGINCRNFDAPVAGFKFSKFLRQVLGAQTDRSTNVARFTFVDHITKAFPNAVKVAESGVGPDNCGSVFDQGFDSILVGTSLLVDNRGIYSALSDFQSAIKSPSARVEALIRQPALA